MDHQHLPLWAQIILDDRRPAPQLLGGRQRRGSAKDETVENSIPKANGRGPELHPALILMAHGSRDPRWRGTFECLHEYVTTRFGDNIHLAFMEFVGPTLLDVAEDCHKAGVRHMRVLPLFMAGGAHVATDIPEQMQQVRDAYPDMAIEALSPIGEDPRMFAVIQEIIGQHAHSLTDPNFTAA